MHIRSCNRKHISTMSMRPGTAVLSMNDCDNEPFVIKDEKNCVDHLSIGMNDIVDEMPGICSPSSYIAENIYHFWKAHQQKGTPGILICCENGIGRSAAVLAAFKQFEGDLEYRTILRHGLHNRLLYKLLLEAAKYPVPSEPLVSIAISVYYPIDRLIAFLLSMRRQRYTNWEVVCVTNGPRPDVRDLLNPEYNVFDFISKVRLIETKDNKGHWGHTYRQLGIDNCKGAYIGLSNDDNYYLPGYIEQMMFGFDDGFDFMLSNSLHSYLGYGIQIAKPERYHCDLGSWLAKESLVRQALPWPGTTWEADGEFIEKLYQVAGEKKTGYVRKPLFIHN